MEHVQNALPLGLRAQAAVWREQAQCCVSRSLANRMLERAAELDDKSYQLERRAQTA